MHIRRSGRGHYAVDYPLVGILGKAVDKVHRIQLVAAVAHSLNADQLGKTACTRLRTGSVGPGGDTRRLRKAVVGVGVAVAAAYGIVVERADRIRIYQRGIYTR